MADHAWCHDVARDAAVRAAEDGRTGPLPTLGECIERQAQACVLACLKDGFARLDEAFGRIPKSVSASSAVEQENKGEGMATKRDEQAADYRAEAIAAPFAEAAERSVPVSKTGERQSGLRTERVTLEVTHDSHLSLRDWPSLRTFFGESVRVVEETHFDDLAHLAMERDAAIREREDSVEFWKGELRSRTAERDGSRARVAELEAAAKLASHANADGKANHAAQAASGGGEGEAVAWARLRATATPKEFFWSDIEETYGDPGDPEFDLKEGETVVPLYRATPQPRGWLTEVVLPEMVIAYDDMDALKEALAAAGVKVKGVGRE